MRKIVLFIIALSIAGITACNNADGSPTATPISTPTTSPTATAGNFSLSISKSGPGLVTQPGEGVFIYEVGSIVQLEVDVPRSGAQFYYWSGDTATIEDIYGWNTTIIMEGNFSITANFMDHYYPWAYQSISDIARRYQQQHNGELPIINNSPEINVSTYYGNSSITKIIDMCSLLEFAQNSIPPESWFDEVPEGCIEIPGNNNDNCDSGGCSCFQSSHYLWTIDENCTVYSVCIGDDCRLNNHNGYQGVWP